MLIFCCVILPYDVYTVLRMDCCVNFGSRATPSGRCCDKDFLPNTNYRAAHSSEYSPQPRIRHIFVAPACLKLDYKQLYTRTESQKVQEWTRQILKLSEVAIFQPHAAYAAYVHGLSYLIRTISDIEDLLQPLENAIHQHFIPALTGRPPCSSSERDLLALPARLGGLSIRDPLDAAAECFRSSERITAPLVALIITQDIDETVDSDTSVAIKNEIKKQNRQRHDEQARAVYDQLTPELKRCTDLSKEKGS